MRDMLQFYIDGEWVDPETPNPFDVINPATEEVCGRISLGSAADVDRAVAAANRAAASYARTTREERIALLEAILDIYKRRNDEVATAHHGRDGRALEAGQICPGAEWLAAH